MDSNKAGFIKIKGACKQARHDDIDWLWADTNCIDKTSSAELSEAINSMFQWYAKSAVCYAYLSDVAEERFALDQTTDVIPDFRGSRWFTRGWTLQELLAPNFLNFYTAEWTLIGGREEWLASEISTITGIDDIFLTGAESFMGAGIAKKMSWLANRTTTRVEDLAYCMLGLFDINMSLLYGEGMKAFIRLQEEIIKGSNDHTIFCWSWDSSVPEGWVSLLAPSPRAFINSGNYYQDFSVEYKNSVSIYSMTNAGLSIRAPVIYAFNHYLIELKVNFGPRAEPARRPYIPVTGGLTQNGLYVSRRPFPSRPVIFDTQFTGQLSEEPLIVMARVPVGMSAMDTWDIHTGFSCRLGLLPTFESEELRSQWTGNWEILEFLDESAITVDLDPDYEKYDNVCVRLIPMMRAHRLPAKHKKTSIAHLLLAVRITRGYPEWFCQILKSRDIVYKPRSSLVSQILKAKIEQRAHYSHNFDVSVVIGEKIDTGAKDRNVRSLHISSGRRIFRLKAATNVYKSTVGKKTNDHAVEDHRSDADSAAAIAGVDPLVEISSRGQFKLRG